MIAYTLNKVSHLVLHIIAMLVHIMQGWAWLTATSLQPSHACHVHVQGCACRSGRDTFQEKHMLPCWKPSLKLCLGSSFHKWSHGQCQHLACSQQWLLCVFLAVPDPIWLCKDVDQYIHSLFNTEGSVKLWGELSYHIRCQLDTDKLRLYWFLLMHPMPSHTFMAGDNWLQLNQSYLDSTVTEPVQPSKAWFAQTFLNMHLLFCWPGQSFAFAMLTTLCMICK